MLFKYLLNTAFIIKSLSFWNNFLLFFSSTDLIFQSSWYLFAALHACVVSKLSVSWWLFSHVGRGPKPMSVSKFQTQCREYILRFFKDLDRNWDEIFCLLLTQWSQSGWGEESSHPACCHLCADQCAAVCTPLWASPCFYPLQKKVKARCKKTAGFIKAGESRDAKKVRTGKWYKPVSRR